MKGVAVVPTVLGMSMTSTGVGWILRDEPLTDETFADPDAVDVASDFVPAVTADDDASAFLPTVRSARAAVDASDRQVNSVQVTWSDDVVEKAPHLLKALSDTGFDKTLPVKLKEAVRSWALASGQTLEFETSAVCLVEASSVAVLAVGYGTVRTVDTTQMPGNAEGLSQWLAQVFATNHLHPDGVFLVGARDDVEPISTSLAATLPVPIVASDPELALARGAAMATPPPLAEINVCATQQAEKTTLSWFQQTLHRTPLALVREAWDRPHAWAAAGLAVCAVAGVIASYALAPQFSGHSEAPPTVDLPASNSVSTSDATAHSDPTSTSVHVTPSPVVPQPEPVVSHRVPKPAVVTPTRAVALPASSDPPLAPVGFGYEENIASAEAAPTGAQSTGSTHVRSNGGGSPENGKTTGTPSPIPSPGEEPAGNPIGDGGGDGSSGGQDPSGGDGSSGGPTGSGGGSDGSGPGGGSGNSGGAPNGSGPGSGSGSDSPSGGQDNSGGQQ
jgi:hypothetical protein